MKVLLLLLAVPLAQAICPRALEGLDAFLNKYSDKDLKEAVDTACGRRHFPTVFWRKGLVKDVMGYVARDSIRRNATICNSACASKMEDSHNLNAFQPLILSLREQFKSMDNAEAKEFVDETYDHEYKFRVKDLKKRSPFDFFSEELTGSLRLTFFHLSIDAQVALSTAMKRAFGVEETAETKQKKVDTAVRAIENAVDGRDDEEIAEIFGEVHKLASEETSFEDFVTWLKSDDHTVWIRPVEVVPALEILYLQYRTLVNDEAKNFINTFLWAWKYRNDGSESAVIRTFKVTKVRTIFSSLSDEASTALKTAFPELFAYLTKNGYITKKMKAIL